MMHRRHSAAGYTLIEMMLGIALALTFAAALSALWLSMTRDQKVLDATRELTTLKLRLVEAYMGRSYQGLTQAELAQLAPEETRGAAGAITVKTGHGVTFRTWGNDAVELIVAGLDPVICRELAHRALPLFDGYNLGATPVYVPEGSPANLANVAEDLCNYTGTRALGLMVR